MTGSLTGSVQSGPERFAFTKTASILSGIACAVPFIFENAFLLSFIMYVPIFFLFFMAEKLKESGKKLYIRVFLYGFFFYATGYIWLAELYPLDFAGFTKPEALGVIVFALTAIPAIHSLLLTVSFAVCRMCTKESADAFKIAVFPCIFVFNEFLQTLGPLAFPWCRVSIAQSNFLPFIQSASLLGSYFITYIVLLINAFIGYAFVNKAFAKKSLTLAISVFVLNTAFGVIRLAAFDRSTEKITAVSLQGNLSSSAKWSGSTDDMAKLYLDLADEALMEAKENGYAGKTVMLMPETALPVVVTEVSKYGRMFSQFSDENDVILAVGAFSVIDENSANSVFVFDESGKVSEPYMKRTLVPFGEYMPYRDLFCAIVPSLAEINMLSSDLYAGTDTEIFDTSAGSLGAVICYESVFPSLCRDSVCDGAEILLVATNDSWFGKSGALRHHLAASRIRAIENNVPVIRAANTGISALINPDGSFEKTLGADVRGYIAAELYTGKGKTLYTHIGDVILLVCLAITAFYPVKSLVLCVKNKLGKSK